MATESDDRWYVQFDSQEVKLMTLDEIQAAFEAGQIHEKTYLIEVGATNWQTLADVAGLSDDGGSESAEAEAPAAPVAAAPAPVVAAPVAAAPAPAPYAAAQAAPAAAPASMRPAQASPSFPPASDRAN